MPRVGIFKWKKIIRDENLKNAYWEDELTKDLYYLHILINSLQMQNRKPPLTTDKICEITMNNLNKFKLTDFRHKFVREGPTDLEGYKNYIIDQCYKTSNLLQTKIGNGRDPKFVKNHQHYVKQIQQCKGLGELSNLMHKQLANDMNLAGFVTNENFTETMRNQSKKSPYTQKIIQDCIDIALQFEESSDSESKKKNNKKKGKTPKKKKIIKNAADLFAFPNKKRKGTFRAMKSAVRRTITDDPALQKKLEEMIRTEMINTIKYNRPSVVIDPNSTIAHTLVELSSKPLIQESEPQVLVNTPEKEDISFIEPIEKNFAIMRRVRSGNSTPTKKRTKSFESESDDEERMGLNFETQLKRELVEQKSSAASIRSSRTSSEGSFDEKFEQQINKLHAQQEQQQLISAQGSDSWPSKNLKNQTNPNSKEAKRFLPTDWEVKLFIEKLEQNLLKRTFRAWNGLKPNKKKTKRAFFSMTLPQVRSKPSAITLDKIPDYESENYVVGDRFLTDFLNSQSSSTGKPERKSSFRRRSIYNSKNPFAPKLPQIIED